MRPRGEVAEGVEGLDVDLSPRHDVRSFDLDRELNAELALQAAYGGEGAAGDDDAHRLIRHWSEGHRRTEAPHRHPRALASRVRIRPAEPATGEVRIRLPRVVQVRHRVQHVVPRVRQQRAHGFRGAVALPEGRFAETLAGVADLLSQRAGVVGDGDGLVDDHQRVSSHRLDVGAGAGERGAKRVEQGPLAFLALPQPLVGSGDHGAGHFAREPADAASVRPSAVPRAVILRLIQLPVEPAVHERHELQRGLRLAVKVDDGFELVDAVLQILQRSLEGGTLAAHVLDVVPLVDDHRRVSQLDPERVADPRVEYVVVRAEHELGVGEQILHGEKFTRSVRIRRLGHVLHVPYTRVPQLRQELPFLVVVAAAGFQRARRLVLREVGALVVGFLDWAVLRSAAEDGVPGPVRSSLELLDELMQLGVRPTAEVYPRDGQHPLLLLVG